MEIIPEFYLDIHLQLQKKKTILVLQWHVEFTLIEGLLGSVQGAWKEALMKGILNQRSGCNRKTLYNIHMNYIDIYMRQNYLQVKYLYK